MESTFQHNDASRQAKNKSNSSAPSVSYPSRTMVHAQLEMTEPGDHDEREANAIADIVASGGIIQRKISGGTSSGVAFPSRLEGQLHQSLGGGQSMPSTLRERMESSFGQDFSQVRLHTDGQAVEMSRSISAKAFTYGNDIYFNQEQFSPDTSAGQRLMAHELTHVVQGNSKIKRWTIDDEGRERGKEAIKRQAEENEDLNSEDSSNSNDVLNGLDFNSFIVESALEEFSGQFQENEDTDTRLENFVKDAGDNTLGQGEKASYFNKAYGKMDPKADKQAIDRNKYPVPFYLNPSGKTTSYDQGDKCNIFVGNVLIKAAQKVVNLLGIKPELKDLKKLLKDTGMLRTRSNGDLVYYGVNDIHKKATSSPSKPERVLQRINYEEVKPGSIVIFNNKGNYHHIEIVLNKKSDSFISVGAHYDGAYALLRAIENGNKSGNDELLFYNAMYIGVISDSFKNKKPDISSEAQ